MAVAAALATVQPELICPICLDYFKDPVTIDCGHNFCASCMHAAWNHELGVFPCPVCRYPHEEKCFTANPQLGRLVDLGKFLHSYRNSEMTGEEERTCEEHGQVLSLFCEDDRELLCSLCVQPPAHEGHLVRPVVEAAFHHRQKLSSYKEPLKTRLAQAQKLAVIQDQKLQGLREYTEKQKAQVVSETEKMQQIVENMQEVTFLRLDEDNRQLQQKLSTNITAITGHVKTLKALFLETADVSVMSEGSLLKEVKSIRDRFESLQFPSLWTIRPSKVGSALPPLCSELEKIIQIFQEDVTLDPHTAHPSLHVSEDRKSVVYMKKQSTGDGKPKRYPDDVAVLGSEGFSSGRHYWEVQVGDKPEWAVGVCTDPASSTAQRPLARPKRFWTIQLQDGVYMAGGSGAALALNDRLTDIGVYLDYELGQISFYDARVRAHIYSFLETFSDVLKPYFLVGRDSTPLIVPAVRDSTE